MRRSFIILSLIFTSLFLYSQNINYYKNKGIEGKSGAQLKSALHNLINSHTEVGYGGLYYVYESSDNKNGRVWDMYSTCNYSFGDKGSAGSVCSGYNREHMIPQSWFNKDGTMKCDAFHVYPTDATVNGRRSNYPHAETNSHPLGGSALGKVGSCSVRGYSGSVYEPDDQYKGDIARTYFYFATCYEGFYYTHDIAQRVFANNKYPGFQSWFLDLMLEWHRQDPVSKKETDRNKAVYNWQYNRNPFIDYPDLAEYIWGNKKNLPFYFSSTPVENIEEVKYQIISNNGYVSIVDLQNESEIILRDLCGRVIFNETVSSSEYSISVKQGIYLLTINNNTTKVIVR